MRIAVGRKNLVDVAFAGGDQLENGNVECAAAEVINGDAAALRFMQAIGKRGGRGLVDKAKHFEARDSAGVFRGLALRVVEIGRHGDDGAVHRFAEMRFRPVFQLAQNESGYFGWRENAFTEPDANYAGT